MCDFCKNVFTGNDYKPIVSSTADLGFAGEISTDVVLVRDMKTGKAAMELSSCMDAKDIWSVDDAPVNFCPVCGEKLNV